MPYTSAEFGTPCNDTILGVVPKVVPILDEVGVPILVFMFVLFVFLNKIPGCCAQRSTRSCCSWFPCT